MCRPLTNLLMGCVAAADLQLTLGRPCRSSCSNRPLSLPAVLRPTKALREIRVREISSTRLLGAMSAHRRLFDHNKTPAKSRHVARGALIGLVVAGVIAASTQLALAGAPAADSGSRGAIHHSALGADSARLTGSSGGLSSKKPKQIDEGLAQVVTPPAWTVQAQLSCPMVVVKDSVLLVGVEPPESKGCNTLPKPGPAHSIVWMFTSTEKGSGKPVRVVNGFEAYSARLGAAHGYLVPRLGVELLWRGGEPASMISTLGWSPLHYVLVGGVAEPPASWKRVNFDGVSVAVPPSWPVSQPLRLECSGPFDNGPVVALGVHVIPVPCAYFPPPTTPTNGVIVSSHAQLGACPIRGTLKVAGMNATACSDPSVQSPELEVKLVFGSGSTKAVVYVVVGLGANATVARDVLGSAVGLVPAP